MLRGIGIDSVSISEMEALRQRLKPQALARMFSEKELIAAHECTVPAEYLAARFAVKEAVFKAIAHLLEEKHFDLRIVETIHCEDGSPQIHITPDMKKVLRCTNVEQIHVSITTEGDFATAFVIAE